MPLYVKDPEVDALAERLAKLRRVSKTEAVRRALARELEAEQAEPSLVEKVRALSREARARAGPGGLPADKAFIDGLYED